MRDAVSHRDRRVLNVVVPEAWPAAAREWLKVTQRDWEEFGGTDLAGLVQPAQMPTLRYLFELRDRRERYMRVTRGGKAVAEGSKGQEVVSPLLKLLPSLNREIRALEAQFGMTPASKKRLIGHVGEADPSKPTLAQLLEEVDAQDVDAEDLRLRVIAGGAG